jgi:predicted ATP-grasp superfamily ATP-dependent carboligase
MNRSDANPTAYVLDVNVFGGIGAMRSLGRAGVPAIGLGSDPQRFGFATKYGTTKQCPNPALEAERLLDFLLSEGQRLDRPGVLLPASDEYVLFLSRYEDELRPYFRFNNAIPGQMSVGVDKRKQYEIAERLGVPYPATFYPVSLAEVDEIKDRLDYPAFIKPIFSHLWRARFPHLGKGVKVHNATELVATCAEVIPAGMAIVVQSIIPGPNTNNCNIRAYISDSGDVLATFTSRKLRQWPVEFGVGTMAESIRDPELVDLGLRFFKGSGYRGFGYIEFKRDERTGERKMIELNARFSAQIIHSTDCGLNFPLIQYRDLAGLPQEPIKPYKTGVRWLSAVSDVRSAVAHVRSGQLTPLHWARQWSSARSFAVFALDDPKPVIPYVRSLISKERRAPLASAQHAPAVGSD